MLKLIRRRFMPSCQKCKWFKRMPIPISTIILATRPSDWYCTKPEIVDKYSMKDYYNYDSVECKICRGEFHCRFKKKEEE